jgi:hypothetical protein
MQKVELYYSMTEAKAGMNQELCSGWKICSCAVAGNKVLVVYETVW